MGFRQIRLQLQRPFGKTARFFATLRSVAPSCTIQLSNCE